MREIRQFVYKEAGRTVHKIPSNFFIEPDGTNVEAEYQAEKHRLINPWRYLVIIDMPPGKAKKFGRKYPMTKKQLREWDARKVSVMRELVKDKFYDHLVLAQWLINTGDAKLVEGNWWHDQFWGDCDCRDHHYRIGKNMLGKILMEVREDLIASV